MSATRLKELRDKLGTLDAQAKAIMNKADTEKRDMTAEEQTNFDAAYAEFDKLKLEADGIESNNRRRAKAAENEAYLKDSGGRQTGPGSSAPLNRPGDDAKGPIKVDFGSQVHRNQRSITIKPGSAAHIRSQPEYTEAFSNYLLGHGVQSGLQTATDTKGGYLAPTAMATTLIKFLDDLVFMRQLANVLPPLGSAVNIGCPSYDTDPGDADWTAEVPASDISEDDTATFGKREMEPHLVTKLIKISMKMLRSAVIDVEQFMAQRLAYKFAITEEKAFLTGSGVQRPLGVFTASTQGISTGRDVTASSSTAFTADDLIDLLYSLKAAYQARATWIWHRDGVKRVRKLKDGDGQYLWQPGLQGGQPNTILDRPYVMSEYAPNTFTTGQYVALVGDFKTGYWIADTLDLEVQRLGELFSLRNQIGMLGRKETDGMPVLEEAFARLKLA